MKTDKRIISITILILLTISALAQSENRVVFPLSSETKYKHFVPNMVFRAVIRKSAKITFIEEKTIQDTMRKNECILLFDRENFCKYRYNLLKKQDSLQYICDGYLLYTISHKTKEVIIEDDVIEKGTELMKNNPFAYFYTLGYHFSFRQKKNMEMFSNEEFVVLNYLKAKTMVHRNGYYSSKFRACDFALSEQKCLLKDENGTSNLYFTKLISLENENENNFTEKDFDASLWYDSSYTIIDKRSLVEVK